MSLKLLLALSIVGGSLAPQGAQAVALASCEADVSLTAPNAVETEKEMKEYVRLCLNQQRASNILVLLHKEIRPLLSDSSKGSYKVRTKTFQKNLPQIEQYLLQIETLVFEDLQMLQRLQNPNDIPLSREEALNIVPEMLQFEPETMNDLGLDVSPIRDFAPKYRIALIDYVDFKKAIDNFGDGPSNLLPDLIQGILDSLGGSSHEKAMP